MRICTTTTIFLPPLLLLVAVGDFTAEAGHKHSHRAPIINLNGAEELVGTIREDERVVSVSPHLHILPSTGPVCHYELSDEDGMNLFESEVLNKAEGTAEIRLRSGESIDCTDSEIHLKIKAVRCGDAAAKSEAVTLKVRVQDVNNHVPEFDAPWYSFDMEEGKVGEVAHLYATDRDCGHPYGKICRYEITTMQGANPWFRIDDQGVLSVVRPLNRSESESHILTVQAEDCGMLKSKSILVTVHVLPQCKDGLQAESLPKQLLHSKDAGKGTRLMPDAKLNLCSRADSCTVKRAETKLRLDRDHYRELGPEAVKQCGMNNATLNLLPKMEGTVKASGEEKNQEYLFDGRSNSVIVPRGTLNSIIPQRFTLAFSMKHSAGSKEEQVVKQNLLCESDDFSMNRHHFAVYLRRCKLELLLRREAENSVSEFRAAEWRWSLDEVCDGEWHSYAIIFSDLDNVSVLVDGSRFAPSERNPEILDDWPLHQTKSHKTRLVVGACWHGRNEKMVQFFNGKLSSMYLLPGEVEKEDAIKCLHQNPERFLFDPANEVAPGESAIFNNDGSELKLKAGHLEELEQLLRKVEYSISAPPKGYLRNGNRAIFVETIVECTEGPNKTIPLGERKLNLTVVSSQQTPLLRSGTVKEEQMPHLFVGGRNLVATNKKTLKVGTAMLPDLQISVTKSKEYGRDIDATAEQKLGWCKVHLTPPRDMDLEYFSSPSSLIASLNLDFEHDKQGFTLKGSETPRSYADVLSRVHYFNTRADSYAKRLYTVQCGLQGGKVISNEFHVTMDIQQQENGLPQEDVWRQHEEGQPTDKENSSSSLEIESELNDEDLQPHYEPPYDQAGGSNRLQNILDLDMPRSPKALLGHHGVDAGAQGAVASGAVAIVVVVCVGFLLVMLVIGVMKIRDGPLPKGGRRRRRMTMDGMEWDDNDGTGSMNITVNPLEEMDKAAAKAAASARHQPLYTDDEEGEDEEDGECRSSEEDESMRGDEEMTDDEEEEKEEHVLPHVENSREILEWDDGSLGQAPTGGRGKKAQPVSRRTYHV